jgi:hypothetical protein
MTDSNSVNEAITLDLSICSRPKDLTPGVSIIQPPFGSSKEIALDEV